MEALISAISIIAHAQDREGSPKEKPSVTYKGADQSEWGGGAGHRNYHLGPWDLSHRDEQTPSFDS